MANLGTITWKVEVDTSDLKRADASMDKAKVSSDALGKSAKTTGTKIDKAGREAKTATEKMERGFKKTRTAASLAATALKTVSAALVIRQVVAYTDAWNNASNQLRVVSSSTAELEKSQRDLLIIANETRAGFASTATLFARLKRSTTELALSDERLLNVTRSITQSFATSGATAIESAGAITQLTQGLAAGALRGQEFNSVLEQAPGITRALRQSLGMTQGELRAFGMEGRITAEIVVEALEKAAESIEQDFNKTVKTFSQNMQIANNSLLEFAGNSGTAQTAVSLAGSAVVLLAENVDILADVAVAAGVALTVRFIPAIAAMAGPIGIITLAIVGMGDAFFRLRKAQDEARQGAADWIAGTGGVEQLDLAILGTMNDLRALNEEFAEQKRKMDESNLSGGRLTGAIARLQAIENQRIPLVKTINELARQRVKLQDETVEVTEEENTVVSVLTETTVKYAGAVTQLTGVMVPLNAETMLSTVSLLDMDTVMDTLRTGTVPGYAETLKDATFRMKGVGEATEKATVEMKLHDNMIEEVQRSWSNLIFDVLDEGKFRFRDFFDSILDGYKRLVAGILAENLAGIIFGNKGLGSIFEGLGAIVPGGGGGTGATGTSGTGTGTASSVLGNIFQRSGGAAPVTTSTPAGFVGPQQPGTTGPGTTGGTGPTGGGTAATLKNIGLNLVAGAAGGFVGGELGQAAFDDKVAQSNIGATVGGIAGSFFGPLGTFIGSAIGSFVDVAAGGDDFIRQNAGFLLSSTGGAGEFDVAAFASGFDPVGFSRRASQGQAISVIDTFRAYDAALTEAAVAAGLIPSLGPTSFGGYDEQAEGNGLFFGSGVGSGGSTGTPITDQLGRYGSQWITAVGGMNGVNPALIAQVIGDSTAAGILARAQGIAGIDGSFAGGLDRVPRDGFIAELHQGERVLTADEARAADASGLGAGVSISENSSFFSLMNFMALNIDNMNDILDQWNGQNFVPVKEQA